MKNKLIITMFFFWTTNSVFAQSNETNYSIAQLKQDQKTTEQLLVNMLNIERMDLVARLLPIYQGFAQKDSKLINYAKIKLAQQLLQDYKNKAAKSALQQLQTQSNLNEDEQQIINQDLAVLQERESWQFSFSSNYIYNKNVNNATKIKYIENTGFVKNEDMMPQSAKGIDYFLNVERNWNLDGSHYLHLSNLLSGKFYWDNHKFDEITNRTYLGYQYQNAQIKWAFKPFYERQWFGHNRYNLAKGVRAEWLQALNKNWQISTALEFAQPRYFTQSEKNGNIKLASLAAIWHPSQVGYLYVGTDFLREQTQEKQYSNDMKSLRIGWKQHWHYQIESQLSVSVSWRKFKDFASIGGILPLDKIRKDKIYNLNFIFWKSDWNWRGFMPKLQFKYKQQKSNLSTMYSYTDKNLQMLIEKDF